MESTSSNSVLLIEFDENEFVWDPNTLNLKFNTAKAPKAKKNQVSIMRLSLKTDEQPKVFWDFEDSNRMIQYMEKKMGEKAILKFLILDFHFQFPAKVIAGILMKGIRINDNNYRFLAYSANQIKKRTCYMFSGSEDEIQNTLNSLGEFNGIKNVSKKAARIGLLFSSCQPTIEIAKCIFKEDIKRNGYTFTDGCGFISQDLAEQISEKADILFRDQRFIPSIFQIRWKGCKGIVVLDPNLPKGSLVIRRESMNKFKTESDDLKTLGLCDYSRPYRYGRLNLQYIMLLTGLGVREEVFLDRFKTYFGELQNMENSTEISMKYLIMQNEMKLANSLITNGITQDVKKRVKEIVALELEKIHKLRAVIEKARNVFGCADPTSQLQYGECFFRPTIDGVPTTLVNGTVVVAKNPCYHLGDIRVLKTVAIKGCDHLVDCIVFPVNGERPHSNEIAGSDLDGDMYFVCWDEDLIPKKTVAPCTYEAVEAPPKKKITTKDLIFNFAYYKKHLVSTLNRYFNLWADKKGPGCLECQEISALFARAIDSAKTGDEVKIPQNLRIETPEKPEIKFVWQKLKILAQEVGDKMKAEGIKVSNTEIFTKQTLKNLLLERRVGISDFELFKFVELWCKLNGEEHSNYWDYIDFGNFCFEECLWAANCGVPKKIINNALNKSTILSEEHLSTYSLEHGNEKWKLFYRSGLSEFKFRNLFQSLTSFEKQLLVFKFANNVNVALYIAKKCVIGVTDLERSAIAYIFSNEVKRKRLLIKKGAEFPYSVSLTEKLCQIYQGTKGNTFIWINNELIDEKNYTRASIDLNRWDRSLASLTGRINRQQFLQLEIFVQEPENWNKELDIEPKGPNRNEDILFQELEEDDTIKDNSAPDKVSDAQKLENVKKSKELIAQIKGGKYPELSEINDILQKFGRAGQLQLVHEVFCELRDKGIVDSDTYKETILIYATNNDSAHGIEALEDLIKNHLNLFSFSDHMKPLLVNLHRKKLSDICQNIWEIVKHHKVELDQQSVSALIAAVVQICSNEEVLQVFKKLLEKMEDEADIQTYCKYLCFAFYCQSLDYAKEILDCINQKMGNRITEINNSKLLDYFNHWTYLITLDLLEQRFQSQQKSECVIRKANASQEKDNKSSGFNLGDIVTISLNSEKDPSTNWVTEGVITQLEPNVVIDLEYVPNDIETKYWRIDKFMNRTTYQRMIKAIQQLCSSTTLAPTITTVLTGFVSDKIDAAQLAQEVVLSTPINFDKSTLNPSQTEAVRRAFSRRFTLIQGPPGTGKTQTACELIHQWVMAKKSGANIQLILGCAETNIAVDNLILKMIAKGLTVMRLGDPSSVKLELREYTLEELLKQKKRTNKGSQKKLIKQLFQEVDVICTTCVKSGSELLKNMEFSHVIIDEVSQAIEPSTLIPLMKGCKQAVLIGDHKQLGPTVISQEANSLGLSKSLYERLVEEKFSVEMLDTQYRMHPIIARFSSEKFYNNKLKDGVGSKERPTPIGFAWPSQDEPLSFVNIEGKEIRQNESICNQEEGNRVIEIVKDLIESGNFEGRDVGIVTPYSAQVESIKNLLTQNGGMKEGDLYFGIEVNTVDGFQGREKEIIVFSAVRCQGTVGFLSDQRRLNVLLTRARRGMVVVGNENTLSKDPTWKSWLEFIKSRNLVYRVEEVKFVKGGERKENKGRGTGRGRGENSNSNGYHNRGMKDNRGRGIGKRENSNSNGYYRNYDGDNNNRSFRGNYKP